MTLRWSGMDSNFQYAGAVNLIVAHLVLGLLLWVSQGVPILRTTLCWREMESNYWFPVAKKRIPFGNRNRNRHEGDKSSSRSGSLSSGYRWFEAISLEPRVRQPTPPRTVTIEIVRIGLGGAAICPTTEHLRHGRYDVGTRGRDAPVGGASN